LNVINFIKEIPKNYSITFIHKNVGKNIIRIYNCEGKTDYKTLSDLDSEIIDLVKNM
jgi:hypothetical protein